MPQRNISPERQGLYYFGMLLTGVGLLLFLSTFVSFISNFGDFTDFRGRSQSGMMRAFGGMICMGIGQFIMRLGRSGVAGSGLKLDPQEARRDLEPWSRLSGGMLRDTLDEAGVDLSGQSKEMPFDEQLRRLESLKRDGLVSEAEYAEAKRKILQSIAQ
ncbi:MAG: SHOCT domain-containing protein [Verrucomicrobia bacterium]|nr:SHOCT domain-containing protein [Verrucomicrobiota bacterium]